MYSPSILTPVKRGHSPSVAGIYLSSTLTTFVVVLRMSLETLSNPTLVVVAIYEN